MSDLRKDAEFDLEEKIVEESEDKKRLKGEILRERKRWAFFGIPWTFTKYILTNKKIVIQKGLFTSEENEILLYRVTDMTMRRSFGQKLFGLGTLVVYAHDKTNPTLEIKNIKRVREFKDTLSEAVEKDRIRMKMRQSEIVDGAFDPTDHDSDQDW